MIMQSLIVLILPRLVSFLLTECHLRGSALAFCSPLRAANAFFFLQFLDKVTHLKNIC